MTPDEIARNQKVRLQGAMAEAVARHGYAGTTLRELVGLAGVSKTTFYERFASKQECFFATADGIVANSVAGAEMASREPGDFRERLIGALASVMQIIVAEPAAASLAIVESLTLGSAGLAHIERKSEAFETLLSQGFERSPAPQGVSPLMVRAIVGGIRGVIYRALREKREEELLGRVEALADWALDCQRPESEPIRQGMAAASMPAAIDRPREGTAPAWKEPPNSQLSRRALSQRERMVRGAVRVMTEGGYGALSVPAISAAAGTSNQTFYENFSDKSNVILAAFEIFSEGTIEATASAVASASSHPEAIGAALRAMLEHIARNEPLARVAFVELPAAGSLALDRADSALDEFVTQLLPRVSPDKAETPVPETVPLAIGSGIWETLRHELARGNSAALSEKAPDLARIALAA